MIRRSLSVCSALLVAVTAVAWSGVAGATLTSSARRGGSITVVVVNQEYLDLDPALDTNAVTDEDMMDNIFGGLFYQTPDSKIGLEMASGYKFSNGNKTLDITLNPGIKFSDGTPLTASALVYNWNRDLAPANFNGGSIGGFSEVTSVGVAGKYTAVMHFAIPDPPIIQTFINSGMNWPGSPTALAADSAGEFGQQPVGAGPYTLQAFSANAKVVLVRNPKYWDKADEPHLSSITFITTSSDQSAYAALEAGTAQMVQGLSTVSLIEQAKSTYKVINVKPVVTMTLELNTYKPPFNNLIAREAVAYALDPQQLLNVNSPGYGQVVQDQEGPGSAYYFKTIPGYKVNNLAKAKALVQQLGGLTMQIQGGTSTANGIQLAALQNELSSAGITVTLATEPLSVEDVNLENGNWQSVTGASGGTDPDVGTQSLVDRFSSTGPYTCCHDPALDGMINQSIQIANPAARDKIFLKIFKYITAKDYSIELYATPAPLIYSPQLAGVTAAPGTSALTMSVDWPDISLK